MSRHCFMIGTGGAVVKVTLQNLGTIVPRKAGFSRASDRGERNWHQRADALAH